LITDPRRAAPVVKLLGLEGAVPRDWESRPDLLGSERDDPHFVVEVDDQSVARLRFGDDAHGRRPFADTQFTATYRSGNGVAGNVGAGTLAHVVTNVPGVTAVTNPLPATGGIDPETSDDVRAYAPFAFRRQERAVTAADYADVCLRRDDVQRAAASFRWTGSWHTAFVTVDRLGGAANDADFTRELEQFLDRFRMAGVDVAVDAPRFVSLELDIEVCVKPEHLRANVRDALMRRFGNRQVAGRRGFFHPDNFSFGQSVFLSEIYRAAQEVPGVDSVRVTRFRRQGTRDTRALLDARIDLGRLEIARLDNDRNYPEHGVLRLTMMGGK
jgi:predicted phage baseplate assembly protein